MANSIDGEGKNGLEAVKYFLDLADALVSHRNYNGAVRKKEARMSMDLIAHFVSCAWSHLYSFLDQMSVVGGLHSSVTWQEGQSGDGLDSESKKRRGRLDGLFAEKRDFHAYRKAVGRGEGACVPVVGVFLSDLYSLANSQWDTPSAALIDFRKRTLLSRLLETFEGYQSEYPFDHIPCVQVRKSLLKSHLNVLV